MIFSKTNSEKIKYNIFSILGVIILLIVQQSVFAQEQPPRPIMVTVSTFQNLNFGTFCYGSGSGTTVTIDPFGVRSSTGDIILMGSSFSAALYDVEGIPGTIINIVNGPDVILTGSNGGTMRLHIGNSNPQSPFVTTGTHTTVTIGGTLTVGSSGANPAGVYGGTFSVTFIQE